MFNKKLDLNLRMFDGTANTNTTASVGVSAEMKIYYEGTLIDHAEPNLVHMQFGDKYPIPKNGGKSIEFRKYSPLGKAMTPLVDGVTPSGQALNVTTVPAIVNQYGGYVTISDMLQLTAIDNNIVQATRLLGGQAGRTLDSIVRDIINAGTNAIFAPKAAGTEVLTRQTLDGTCKLTPDLIFKAARKLKTMNAERIDGSYIGIIHPDSAYDLMRHPEWIELTKYKDTDKYYEGEIGKIGNVRFVESTEAKIWKGTGTNAPEGLGVYSTLIIGASAYGTTEIEGGGLEHISKQKGSAGTSDPLDQRATVGWKATATAERLVEEYMVRIESCGTYAATVEAN